MSSDDRAPKPKTALVEVRALREKLAASTGRQKLELLMSGEDPGALIRRLPASDLYFAILDIGAEDAIEVISLATPEQFNHFIDVSCWPRRDAGPDPRKLMRWLVLAREGGGLSDRARRRYFAKLEKLDPELFALGLRHELIVHDLSENDDPELADDAQTYRTPEGKYVIELRAEGSGYAAQRRLLDDLNERDPFITTRVLESLRWEVPTELEESARRWREGRLRDQGVPDLEEALSFFARPAAAPAASKPPRAASAGSALTTVDPTPLLERALLRLSVDGREIAHEGVVYACNAALVAGRVQLDDAAEVRRALTDARAILSLGLELLSNGDEELAARLLEERPTRAIFQAAMAELYRLQSRARAIAKTLRLPQAQSATLVDLPLSALLTSLHTAPPTLAMPVAQGDGDDGTLVRTLAPSSRLDLQRAELLLDETAALAGLLAALGHELASLGAQAETAQVGPTALRLTDLVRAHAVSRLTHQPFSLKELPDQDGPRPAGFDEAVDAVLAEALGRSPSEALRRAVQRLRAQVTRS